MLAMHYKKATYSTFRPDPKPPMKLPDKKKAVSKTPTTTIGQLMKEADAVWSEYIRQEYADRNGKVKCFTCPTIDHWKNMHCGHFINRDQNAVRFDFRNTHPQCPECNIVKRGNIDEYENQIEFTYGKGTAAELKRLARLPFKLDREKLTEIITNYKTIKR